MSEPTPATPTETPQEPPTPAAAAPVTADEAALGEAGKRALQSERDARSAAEKRAADAEAQVQKFKDANLTEQQRIEKERDDARSEHSKAADRLARYEAAAKAGLPLTAAPRLIGTTPAELEADAKAMKAERDALAKPGTPAPDRSAGAGGTQRAAGSVSAGRELYAESRKK